MTTARMYQKRNPPQSTSTKSSQQNENSQQKEREREKPQKNHCHCNRCTKNYCRSMVTAVLQDLHCTYTIQRNCQNNEDKRLPYNFLYTWNKQNIVENGIIRALETRQKREAEKKRKKSIYRTCFDPGVKVKNGIIYRRLEIAFYRLKAIQNLCFFLLIGFGYVENANPNERRQPTVKANEPQNNSNVRW